MNAEDIKDTVKRELPNWLREDPAFRTYVMELTRGEYADHRETSDRFCDILGELRRDRERQDQKRAENNREWDENQAALAPMREEDALQWDENQSELKRLHAQLMEQARKYDRGTGALGSRWGKQSEKAFGDALAGMLERSFDVKVVNVTKYDDTGEVFGRPDQIELDVIIKNGLLLICELKSSIDKAGMYSFERKARFYERHHNRQADRLIVVSPMIDARTQQAAARLGIDTYGDSTDVETILPFRPLVSKRADGGRNGCIIGRFSAK